MREVRSLAGEDGARRYPWWTSPAAWLVGGISRLLLATYRPRVVAGGEHVERLVAGGRPMVLALWHNQLVGAGRFFWPLVHRSGLHLASLVSLSKDGELLTRATRYWSRFEVVRGSASRGGLGGVRRLHRAISRQGASVALAPDGPRGPLYEVKAGVLVLAQASQSPVLPMAVVAERFWRVKSWDRLMIPKPFSRLAVVVGEPIAVPRRQSSEELQRRVAELGQRLHEVTEQAAGAFDGVGKPSRG